MSPVGINYPGSPCCLDTSLLEQSALLKHLSDAEKEALFKMVIARSYKAGDLIFDEHEKAYSIIMPLAGRVGLQMDLGNGRRLTVSTVEPGELAAWSGLVPPYEFTSSARAIENTDVAIFKSEDLRRLFDENPRLGYQFMQQIAAVEAERLRDTRLQLMGLFT